MEGRIRRVRTRDTDEISKPCPFCGQVPMVNKHFRDAMWSLMHRCPVIGAILLDWTEDKRALVRRWNTRHEK